MMKSDEFDFLKVKILLNLMQTCWNIGLKLKLIWNIKHQVIF